MRDFGAELKQLRLHGMASAWADLLEQDQAGLDSARWLIEHLLQAEITDSAMRSVSHQMHAAKFPVHRDLAGFDFTISPVDHKLVLQLAETGFTEVAHAYDISGLPHYNVYDTKRRLRFILVGTDCLRAPDLAKQLLAE